MSIPVSSSCIRDCSLLNQTTCQPIRAKRIDMNQEDIHDHLWYPDGCYNSSLFKDTEEYMNYDKVKRNIFIGKAIAF